MFTNQIYIIFMYIGICWTILLWKNKTQNIEILLL